MKKSRLRNTFKVTRRKIKIFLVVVIVLIAVRLVLPFVVLHYANKTLASMDGYYGKIRDIDISLYRGAYQIVDIYIDKIDSNEIQHVPFFESKLIDLSIEWNALFHGSFVGEMEFISPKLVFTKDKADLEDVKKDTTDFRILLDDFMPLKINRFAIIQGNIHYMDEASKPKVNLALKNVHLVAQNLTNAIDEKQMLPSDVTATADAYEGTLKITMKLNPLADKATFDLNAELKNTNLVLLNDFLKAYGHFDVHKGSLGLYTEMAASKGKFIGYVKPIIKDLDVTGPEDSKDSFFNKAWETLVGAAGLIFRNQKEKQVATKIPMEGTFENPDTKTFDAVLEVLKNAFIQALIPSIDNQIDINSTSAVSGKKQ